MRDMSRVTVTKVSPRSIAGIGAFRERARLLEAMQDTFGMAIPTVPGWVRSEDVVVSCLTPTRYFATAPRDTALPARLARDLSGLAALTDQSDLWAIFGVAGVDVREVLARLVPIDLHSDTFREGDVAMTRAGHLDVRLWRVSGIGYEIAVTRSLASDLQYALNHASAG